MTCRAVVNLRQCQTRVYVRCNTYSPLEAHPACLLERASHDNQQETYQSLRKLFHFEQNGLNWANRTLSRWSLAPERRSVPDTNRRPKRTGKNRPPAVPAG